MKLSIVFWSYASSVFGGVQAGCVYDYLVKRNLQAIAKAFLNECKVSSDPVGMLHASSRCMAMAIFT
jgi:hypothetical protein